MIKLLHTGDIHLDSPFSGLNPTQAEIRRNELRAAFTSMMAYAKMNNVDALLVAGDTFDSEYVTRETLSLLCREFANFGKPVVIAPGNHDCASADSVWQKDVFPKNVYVFREEALSSFDFDEIGLTVYGYAFTGREMASAPFRGEHVENGDRINVLLAHADTVSGKESTNCPTTENEILAFGADYTALGHIHNPPSPEKNNRFSYCGCLEPRGFDELGPKGALTVEIADDRRVTIKPVRFSKRRYERGELTLDGASTMAEVSAAIRSCLAENRYGEDTILALRLKGYVSPSLLIRSELLRGEDFGLFSLRIEDATHPELDFAALEEDITVRGEVYRQLKPALRSTDPRTREIGRRALRYAFSSLAGEGI